MTRLSGALLGLVLSPLSLLVAMAVRVLDGKPVLFSQERAGLDGHPFLLYKFRTMRPGAADEPDSDRITRLGAFLRRTSLDELPELWNVLRGDMKVVGPRPLPTAYTPLYSPSQRRRLEVKPGLTGAVQVRGRNGLAWDEKFALDTWYVEHRSAWLDLRLLIETPLAVARGRGIAHDGHATMPVFTGSDPEDGRTPQA